MEIKLINEHQFCLGYWLKDSSQILEPTGAPSDVDYRTERYHLDDLLKKQ